MFTGTVDPPIPEFSHLLAMHTATDFESLELACVSAGARVLISAGVAQAESASKLMNSFVMWKERFI